MVKCYICTQLSISVVSAGSAKFDFTKLLKLYIALICEQVVWLESSK